MLAAETRAIASEMTSPDAKRIMLSIAEAYEFLAARAETRKTRKNSS